MKLKEKINIYKRLKEELYNFFEKKVAKELNEPTYSCFAFIHENLNKEHSFELTLTSKYNYILILAYKLGLTPIKREKDKEDRELTAEDIENMPKKDHIIAEYIWQLFKDEIE